MTDAHFPSICQLARTAKELAHEGLMVEVFGAITEIEGFLALITHEVEQHEEGEPCDFSFDFGELRGFVADLENDLEKLKGIA